MPRTEFSHTTRHVMFQSGQPVDISMGTSAGGMARQRTCAEMPRVKKVSAEGRAVKYTHLDCRALGGQARGGGVEGDPITRRTIPVSIPAACSRCAGR